MSDRCCVCGRELTFQDYLNGTMVVEEWDNPYTDDVEIAIYCSDCYDELFGEDEEDFLLEWDDC